LITRRHALAAALCAPLAAGKADAPRIAVTMDDVAWRDIPEPYAARASETLLGALSRHGLHTALFPAGKRVDDDTGRAILRCWSDAGNIIGNHTWSHRSFHAVDAAWFEQDMLRCDALVRTLPGFRPFFRFPMLKEGDTAAKRDEMRRHLSAHGYRNGYVTIDASDWYYDQRLRERLAAEPAFAVARYRRPYLDHLWNRALYYDGLSRQVMGRSVPHTVLIHYNLINVLFLGDVLDMFAARGWRTIDAAEAYADPVFLRQPRIVPAGESLIWALAKETGRFDSVLRYPGEDGVYEKPILDRLRL
jgi:hypothetical protein